MKRIKLLIYTLLHIGPKSFFYLFAKSIYENKTVHHYKLFINSLRQVHKNPEIKSKIYCTFDSLDNSVKEKIKKYFNIEKLRVFKERLDYTSDIVVSYINKEFISFCFFAYGREIFQFFDLPKGEIYFYDCFTFPEYRGRGVVPSEVEYVLNIFKDRDYTFANVEIEIWNKSSIRAFEKVGFYKMYEFHLKRILFFERIVKA
jgi:ribosomal protein S18 acetylase RimI-like enzyme